MNASSNDTGLTLSFSKLSVMLQAIKNENTHLIKIFVVYFIVFDVLIIFPAVFGNSLILISIGKFKRLRTRMYVLVANLAFSDLLVGLCLIPMDFAVFVMDNDTQLYLNMKRVCLARLSLSTSFLLASVLNLFLISLERYVAVVHPLTSSSILTNTRLVFGIVCCWGIALTYGSLPLMGWNSWDPTFPCDPEVVLSSMYIALGHVILIMALVSNIVMLVKVVRTAWRQIKRINIESNIDHDKSKIKHGRTYRDMHKAKVMTIILGVFAVCWTPYCISALVDIFIPGKASEEMIIVRTFLYQLGVLNSGLNWIIYGLKNKDFRNAFKTILKGRKISNDDSLAMSSGAARP